MSEAFSDHMGWVVKSTNLSASLGRAFSYAHEQGHRGVTVEHLLLALTEDPDAGALLSASGIELNGLRSEVAGFVSRQNDRFAPGENGRPLATEELAQIFDYASAAAEQSGRDRIDGAIVLAALNGEGRSPAAELLKTHGLTFEQAVQSLHRRNIGADPAGTQPAPGQPAAWGATPDPYRNAGPAAAGEAGRAVGAAGPGAAAARRAAAPGTGKTRRFRADQDVLESVRRRLAEGDDGRDGQVMTAELPGTHEQPAPREARPGRDMPRQAPRQDPPRSDAPADGRPDAAAAEPPMGDPGQAPGLRMPADQRAGSMGSAQPASRADAPPPSEGGAPGRDPHGQRPREPDARHVYPQGQSSPRMQSQTDYAAAERGTEARTMPPRDAAQPHRPDAGADGLSPERRQRASAGEEPRRGPPPGGQPPGQAHTHARQAPADRADNPSPGYHHHYRSGQPAGQAAPERDFPVGASQPAGRPAEAYRSGPAPGSQGYPPSHARPGEQGPAMTRPAPGPMQYAPPEQRGDVAGGRAPIQARDAAGDEFAVDDPRAGLLVENIPRTMVVAVPETVEVRMARSEVEALAEGLQGRGAVQTHDVFVTRAMSVRLRAPQGGFWIESSSPETQWIEGMGGLLQDDFACWRWTVLPERKGKARLQLIVSARTAAPDGMTAETALPDQVIDLKVRTNYRESAKRWAGWAAAALAGGLLGAWGQQAWGTLSRIFGS